MFVVNCWCNVNCHLCRVDQSLALPLLTKSVLVIVVDVALGGICWPLLSMPPLAVRVIVVDVILSQGCVSRRCQSTQMSPDDVGNDGVDVTRCSRANRRC
jgi:hypothetical protein